MNPYNLFFFLASLHCIIIQSGHSYKANIAAKSRKDKATITDEINITSKPDILITEIVNYNHLTSDRYIVVTAEVEEFAKKELLSTELPSTAVEKVIKKTANENPGQSGHLEKDDDGLVEDVLSVEEEEVPKKENKKLASRNNTLGVIPSTAIHKKEIKVQTKRVETSNAAERSEVHEEVGDSELKKQNIHHQRAKNFKYTHIHSNVKTDKGIPTKMENKHFPGTGMKIEQENQENDDGGSNNTIPSPLFHGKSHGKQFIPSSPKRIKVTEKKEVENVNERNTVSTAENLPVEDESGTKQIKDKKQNVKLNLITTENTPEENDKFVAKQEMENREQIVYNKQNLKRKLHKSESGNHNKIIIHKQEHFDHDSLPASKQTHNKDIKQKQVIKSQDTKKMEWQKEGHLKHHKNGNNLVKSQSHTLNEKIKNEIKQEESSAKVYDKQVENATKHDDKQIENATKHDDKQIENATKHDDKQIENPIKHEVKQVKNSTKLETKQVKNSTKHKSKQIEENPTKHENKQVGNSVPKETIKKQIVPLKASKNSKLSPPADDTKQTLNEIVNKENVEQEHEQKMKEILEQKAKIGEEIPSAEANKNNIEENDISLPEPEKSTNLSVIAISLTLIITTLLLTLVGVYFRKISLERRRYIGHSLLETEEDMTLFNRETYHDEVSGYESWQNYSQ